MELRRGSAVDPVGIVRAFTCRSRSSGLSKCPKEASSEHHDGQLVGSPIRCPRSTRLPLSAQYTDGVHDNHSYLNSMYPLFPTQILYSLSTPHQLTPGEEQNAKGGLTRVMVLLIIGHPA